MLEFIKLLSFSGGDEWSTGHYKYNLTNDINEKVEYENNKKSLLDHKERSPPKSGEPYLI